MPYIIVSEYNTTTPNVLTYDSPTKAYEAYKRISENPAITKKRVSLFRQNGDNTVCEELESKTADDPLGYPSPIAREVTYGR